MASAIQLRMGTGHTTKYYNINPTTIQHSHSFFQIFFVSTPGSNLSPEQTSQSKPHPTVQKWGQPSYQRSQKFHLPFLCETKSLCVTKQLNYQITVSLSWLCLTMPPLVPCNLCRRCVLFLSIESVAILDQLVAAQDQENDLHSCATGASVGCAFSVSFCSKAILREYSMFCWSCWKGYKSCCEISILLRDAISAFDLSPIPQAIQPLSFSILCGTSRASDSTMANCSAVFTRSGWSFQSLGHFEFFDSMADMHKFFAKDKREQSKGMQGSWSIRANGNKEEENELKIADVDWIF